jgi:hypothetical protein
VYFFNPFNRFIFHFDAMFNHAAAKTFLNILFLSEWNPSKQCCGNGARSAAEAAKSSIILGEVEPLRDAAPTVNMMLIIDRLKM